jgi:cellulose synthase/poly-beta-1,6-N-acetylglucosamine synthase-like glycosyltransferase
MTGTQTTFLLIYGAIVAIWPIRLVVLEIILRRIEILTARSLQFRQGDPPRVSAILPAKDEEAHLAECLGSICTQTYPNLEILVVDDRSIDRTGEIARQFAARDPRIRVLTIDQLPAGWTGKTHALARATAEARGDWLWFMDADTVHAPESLAIMMEHARSHHAALVSLLPELRCETFWEQIVQPLGAIVLMQSFPLHRVNDDRSRLAFANGQYILIERSAYNAAGGHATHRSVSSCGAGAASCTMPWTARPGGYAPGCWIRSSSAKPDTSHSPLDSCWSRLPPRDRWGSGCWASAWFITA